MTRLRRSVDNEGRLECGLCGELVYIWNFYTLPVIDDVTDWKDIWYEKDGKLYGMPKSYCRPCNRISQKGRKAMDIWRTVCVNKRLERIDDPIKAETKAYIEAARRGIAERRRTKTEVAMEMSRNGSAGR
jgi:hypothetical protein